jgi:AcrR family transcriptional regulator
VYGVDKGSATAARIADAAREILIAEGAAAVSMRRVAAIAGLTPMAIYRHFANREVLLQRVADASFQAIAAQWAERTLSGTVEERLHAVLDDYLDFALAQPRLYEFVFGERREDARMYPTDFRAGRSPTLNVLAELLAEGARDGTFRDDDVWEVAITLAAFIHGFVQLFHNGRITMPDDAFRQLCHTSTGRFFNGLKT